MRKLPLVSSQPLSTGRASLSRSRHWIAQRNQRAGDCRVGEARLLRGVQRFRCQRSCDGGASRGRSTCQRHPMWLCPPGTAIRCANSFHNRGARHSLDGYLRPSERQVPLAHQNDAEHPVPPGGVYSPHICCKQRRRCSKAKRPALRLRSDRDQQRYLNEAGEPGRPGEARTPCCASCRASRDVTGDGPALRAIRPATCLFVTEHPWPARWASATK
jgi:hypothetical protein